MNKQGQSAIIFIGVTIAMAVFVLLSFFTETEMTKIVLLILAFVSFVVGFVVYWEFAYGPNKIRREIKKATTLLRVGSTEELKSAYMKIYQLYMKLSPKQKSNFYVKVTDLRETIEEFMQGEKRLEQLSEKVGVGNIAEQKKTYDEMHKQFRKLPEKTKKKHYPNLVRAKERLEKGG